MYQLREATKGKRPRCLKCIPYNEGTLTQPGGTEEEDKKNSQRRRSSPSPANMLGMVTKAIGVYLLLVEYVSSSIFVFFVFFFIFVYIETFCEILCFWVNSHLFGLFQWFGLC